MSRTIFLVLTLALIAAGCMQNSPGPNNPEGAGAAGVQTNGGSMSPEKVSFSSSDGIALKALYYKNPGKPGVILLPMLGRAKETWGDFASELQKNGFEVLALDPRGHGESQGDLGSFSAQDFNKMVLDVAAAQWFLNKNRVFVAGASIGANTALSYAAQNPEKTLGIVLLSPGLNYRGVDVSNSVFNGRTLVAASSEDSYSFESSKTIAKNNNAEFLQYSGLGHGTAMLSSGELRSKIIAFLSQQ